MDRTLQTLLKITLLRLLNLFRLDYKRLINYNKDQECIIEGVYFVREVVALSQVESKRLYGLEPCRL
jgi:hypothetical protein